MRKVSSNKTGLMVFFENLRRTQDLEQKGESMRVRKIAGAVAGAAVALMLTMGTAVSASATTEYPEGGTWNYGVRSGGIYGSGGQVYSEYYHGSRTHKATACGYGGCAYSGWKSSGTWANAYHSPMAAHGNTAYYDVQ